MPNTENIEGGDNPIQKVSIAKNMSASGVWPGLGENQEWLNGITPHDSKTGAAIIVDRKTKWPEAMVKPKRIWPDPESEHIDSTAVVENAFRLDDTKHHQPVTKVADITTGSENEIRLVNTRVSAEMHERIKEEISLNQSEIKEGYTTYEVSDDQIEGNRPVVPSTMSTITASVEKHNKAIIDTVTDMGGGVTFTSSRPNTDNDVTFPPDPYVANIVGLLATPEQFTQNESTLEWIAYSSQTVLGEMTGAELRAKLDKNDPAFNKKCVVEFDPSAIHTHHRMPEDRPNPNFVGEFLNKDMGVVSQAMGVITYSGPFRNGHYSKLHEFKPITRSWFRKAGYQPAYHPMGTPEQLQELSTNATVKSATSFTRANITGDVTYGNSRARMEPLRTGERLMGSSTPLPEVEAAFSFSGSVDMAILSHYFDLQDQKCHVPAHMERYFTNPNKTRYNLNRISLAVYGPFADIIDGQNKPVSYKDFINDYLTAVESETKRLGIETAPDDFKEFRNTVSNSVNVPADGWNIANHLDKNHKDYGKGVVSTHLIAELMVKRTSDEKWRTQYQTSDGEWHPVKDYEDGKKWYKEVLRVLPEGNYEAEISEVMGGYTKNIKKRYE